MTRVLLDTPALLWALTDPDRLGPDAARLLRDRAVEPIVSAATAWEIATKVRLGKLLQAEALTDRYDEHLRRLGAVELPIDARHALLAGGLRWQHRDPFDRMLAAQALVEQLPLVTADAAFDRGVGLRIRW